LKPRIFTELSQSHAVRIQNILSFSLSNPKHFYNTNLTQCFNLNNTGIMPKAPLIFFVYPDPMGSEENQFTPLGAGVNKLIFKQLIIMYSSSPDSYFF